MRQLHELIDSKYGTYETETKNFGIPNELVSISEKRVYATNIFCKKNSFAMTIISKASYCYTVNDTESLARFLAVKCTVS